MQILDKLDNVRECTDYCDDISYPTCFLGFCFAIPTY